MTCRLQAHLPPFGRLMVKIEGKAPLLKQSRRTQIPQAGVRPGSRRSCPSARAQSLLTSDFVKELGTMMLYRPALVATAFIDVLYSACEASGMWRGARVFSDLMDRISHSCALGDIHGVFINLLYDRRVSKILILLNNHTSFLLRNFDMKLGLPSSSPCLDYCLADLVFLFRNSE